MSEEEFVLYPVSAIIIATGKLTLNFYECSKARTALSAPVAIEYHHIVDRMLAGGVIKERGESRREIVKKVLYPI